MLFMNPHALEENRRTCTIVIQFKAFKTIAFVLNDQTKEGY